MILIIIGGLFVLFGAVDIIGSFAGFDVWTDYIGVDLPQIIWSFSGYIEIVLGSFLYKIGSKMAHGSLDETESTGDEQAAESAESEE